ncbi:MAG: hypothetical protein ACT4P0_08140 [Panacagrimonas sp.]
MTTAPQVQARAVYVRRDGAGQIVSISPSRLPDHDERCAPDHPDLAAFVQLLLPGKPAFLESDLALIRVVEDLVDVLIHKDVLKLTDLPERVQEKLQARRRLRMTPASLDLLSDGQDTI